MGLTGNSERELNPHDHDLQLYFPRLGTNAKTLIKA
jgi:hypothetical protein